MCSMQGVQNQGCSEGMDAALASTVNRTAGLLCPQFELTFGLLCIQETVPLPYLFMNPKLSPHMRSWLSQRSWVQLLTYATSRIPLGSCWIRKDKSPSTLVLDWKQAGGLSKVRGALQHDGSTTENAWDQSKTSFILSTWKRMYFYLAATNRLPDEASFSSCLTSVQ